MSGLLAGDVWISDTPTVRYPMGAIKGALRPLTHLATLLTWKHFESKLLELKLSLPQASLKSKPPRRDLSHLLTDPLDLQAKHFTDNLRVFVTLGDLSPRRTRCPLGATKVVVSLRKFGLPSASWGFDSVKLNKLLVIVRWGLGSRETWPFVGTFVVSWTSGTNLVSLVLALISLLFLHKFDLTLVVILSE
jgi:hypothetical protein